MTCMVTSLNVTCSDDVCKVCSQKPQEIDNHHHNLNEELNEMKNVHENGSCRFCVFLEKSAIFSIRTHLCICSL